MTKYLTLLLLGALFALPAHADPDTGGFFLEPALTYESGDWTATFPSPFNDTSGSTSGFGLDLKAGFHFAGIVFIAADGMISQPTFKNPANNYEAKATETNVGALVGLQMPVTGLRLWGEYVFHGDLDPDSSNGVNLKFKDAHGYKFGVGFQVSHVSLNLEYLALDYDRTELEALGPFATTADFGNTQLKNKSYILSVSLPIAL